MAGTLTVKPGEANRVTVAGPFRLSIAYNSRDDKFFWDASGKASKDGETLTVNEKVDVPFGNVSLSRYACVVETRKGGANGRGSWQLKWNRITDPESGELTTRFEAPYMRPKEFEAACREAGVR